MDKSPVTNKSFAKKMLKDFIKLIQVIINTGRTL